MNNTLYSNKEDEVLLYACRNCDHQLIGFVSELPCDAGRLRKGFELINEAYCEDFDIGNGHYCIMGWPSTNFYDSKQPYLVGCYGLLMVGVGLVNFPTCPQEALLLQKDIVEAKEYLTQKGVDVSSS